MHERRLQESNLGLGRMHVHVDAIRWQLKEQVHLRTPLLDGGGAIGVGDGVRDRPVLDGATIHEQILRSPDRPVTLPGQPRRKAAHRHTGRGLLHLNQMVPRLVELKQPLIKLGRRRTLQQAAATTREGETDLWVTERKLRHQPGDLGCFGPIRLKELPAGGDVAEEVGHLNRRPLRCTYLTGGRGHSCRDPDLDASVGATRAGAQKQIRHRGDTGERLAPEAQGRDGGQVLESTNFARRVTFECEGRLLSGHPLAVILDPDQPLAP